MITSIPLVLAPRHLWRVTWLVVSVWTLALAASVVWNAWLLRQTMLQVATQEARSSFNKDVLYRRWAASHGGVYVPVTATTPPNPYLTNIAERDLVTPSGRRLTLVNPAYMTRQVHELGQQYGSRGHITSLKPLRLENAPDAWEAAALRAFEQGQTEVISRALMGGEPHLRFMKPLVTEAACLKCHAAQGYKEGDIRGGISVGVELAPYLALAQAQPWPIAAVHAGLWALGVLGIGWGARQMRQRRDQQFRAEEALRESSELFSLFMCHSPIYTYIKTVTPTESRVLQASDNFHQMIGRSGSEIVGKTMAELFPAELAAKITADDWGVVTSGEVLKLEEDLNGRSYATIKFPIVQGDKTLVAGYTIDITERRQAEESRRQQAEELRAHNEQLTRFNRAAVGRELRMIELKQEVNELCGQAGQPPRYVRDSVKESGPTEP